MKFDIFVFFENLLRKFKFYENLTRITGTTHEDQHTCFIISRLVLLRMKHVSDKSYIDNQNPHFMFSDFYFENRAVNENVEK